MFSFLKKQQKSAKKLGAIFTCLASMLLAGCVTTHNNCGNEQRDWDNLHFPKNHYCSVPTFLPFAEYYEAANKAVCKVHDNNSGKNATMSQREADRRFLCDYMKHSELSPALRTITGYMSYALLRMGAPYEPPEIFEEPFVR